MLDFLWDNKAWLFEGAGVAVVVGLVTFLYHRVRRKLPGSPSHITVVQVVEANKQSATASRASESAVQLTKVTRISPLSFQEILEAVKDAPPLQVEAVGERFKGITVQWNAQVFRIEKTTNEKVRLTLHFGPDKPGLIFCEVLLSQYKELGYLKKEAPVTVLGVVERTAESTVTLEDAQLFFTSEKV